MRKIFVALALLAAAFGLFLAVVILLREGGMLSGWIPSALLPDVLSGVGVILVMFPFILVLQSVFELGLQKQRKRLAMDVPSSRSLRLPPGVRWGCIILSAGLWAGIVAALWLTDENIGIWLFTAPLQLLCLYGLIVFAIIQGHYNEKALVVMGWTLRTGTFHWSELEGISLNEQFQELHLHFSGGRKARVTLYFSGIADLLQIAKTKLKANQIARTARS